jgi:hypothetical protein
VLEERRTKDEQESAQRSQGSEHDEARGDHRCVVGVPTLMPLGDQLGDGAAQTEVEDAQISDDGPREEEQPIAFRPQAVQEDRHAHDRKYERDA